MSLTARKQARRSATLTVEHVRLYSRITGNDNLLHVDAEFTVATQSSAVRPSSGSFLEANVAFMQAFSQKLTKTGELVITAGLAAPDQAKKVRAGKDGQPITDGVFPESKEFLAGWWIVEVDSEARAGDCGGGSHGARHLNPKLGRDDDRPPLGRSARGAG